MNPPHDPISRRGFLVVSAGLVAAACGTGSDNGADPTTTTTTTGAPPVTDTPTTTSAAPTTTIAVPEMVGDPFTLGVASGDPLPDAVVIWTRLAPEPMASDGGLDADAAPVRWEMASDPSFQTIVVDGEFVTTADHGHSVHVDVTGLEAASTYWYRFSVGDWTSSAGRTRTAPAADAAVEGLRFAVANCSAWKSGYFTPYAHLTEEELDAVLFVGDHIYELESGFLRDHGLPNPFTVEEYRCYYTFARLEPELVEAHAPQHPWIVMWDDHEVEDNYAGWNPGGIGLALDDQAAAGFRDRRIAAYQAWWEFMPVRTGTPVAGDLQVYRDFEWGDLAKITLIDDRQYRSPLIEGEGNGTLPRPFGGGPPLEATFDESPTMLGMVHDEGIENFVVVGGDIHTSAVADLHVSYRDPEAPMVGTEFVAPSVTSLELLLPEFVEGSRSNPHVHLSETEHRGSLIVDVTHDQLVSHFRWVDTTQEPTSPITTASSWRVTAGAVGVQQI